MALKDPKPSHFAVGQCLGASAGALVGTALILGYPASNLLNTFMNITEKAYSFTSRALSPDFHANSLHRDELEIILPENAEIKVSGKHHTSMTDLSGQNVVVSHFDSRNDLIDALLC